MLNRLVIGSRGSPLALCQTDWARTALLQAYPGLEVRIDVIRTKGDHELNLPVARIGGKRVFTREIEEALLDGRIDLAVHSLKDLPTRQPRGLRLAAISRRWDVRDALVSRNGHTLKNLPEGSVVGTGSLRRQAQLRHIRPDLRVEGIRGNVDTRLRKLDAGEIEAVVLAAAGLRRLGLAGRASEFLSARRFLPAPGQGALGIEIRQDDDDVAQVARCLHDCSTHSAVSAERAMLDELAGGCQMPVGAWARLDEGCLIADGMVADPDGGKIVRARTTGDSEDSLDVGRRLSDLLIERGAKEILCDAL
ncbi:MAG: hydroxymethylbilane synthase [Gemmatimonadetes bacterium]|nr:hydroxymethylbilane synthase [Gemmatimonadota bacterium]